MEVNKGDLRHHSDVFEDLVFGCERGGCMRGAIVGEDAPSWPLRTGTFVSEPFALDAMVSEKGDGRARW